MQDDSDLSNSVSVLQQQVQQLTQQQQQLTQQQQDALAFGTRLRSVACQLLLLAWGDQPQPPGAGTTRFKKLAGHDDRRLVAYTNWVNESALLPFPNSPMHWLLPWMAQLTGVISSALLHHS